MKQVNGIISLIAGVLVLFNGIRCFRHGNKDEANAWFCAFCFAMSNALNSF